MNIKEYGSIRQYKSIKAAKDYESKSILKARLRSRSAQGSTYSIYMDDDEIIHIYPDAYVPEYKKHLRESDEAICGKYPIK